MNTKTTGIGLMLMSFSSGCMDILSYRFLGQVFTSAMTGNAALLGLDLGRGDVSGASRNLTAFVSFLAGLVLGATLLRRRNDKTALVQTLLAEEVFLIGFALVWHFGNGPATEPMLYGLIALSAVAMGLQSAAAHRIGVPGITTTYFTGTLTNIVFGLVGRPASTPVHPMRRFGWPLLAFAAYVGGAIATGFLTIHQTTAAALPMVPAATVAVLLLLTAFRR